MDFQTGKIISHTLASNGYPAAIYDQRGSGVSVMSGRNHPTPENLASDLYIAYEHLKKTTAFSGKNLNIIAHGHGCIPALLAVNKFNIPVKRIYLLSCVFPGTLLDSWLIQILNNMERAGVTDSTLQEAKIIINKWKKQKEIKLLKDGETNEVRNKDQDIQSLYRALDYMQKEQMHAWTVQAKDISFLNEISKLNRNIEVYHILNEYDEEFAVNLAISWQKIISDGGIKRDKNKYMLQIIPGTDHFFMEIAARSRGVIRLIFQRINPFREMDKNLFRYLLHPET
jgi:pimeloyl-ACP methyl ester carboxylesterase